MVGGREKGCMGGQNKGRIRQYGEGDRDWKEIRWLRKIKWVGWVVRRGEIGRGRDGGWVGWREGGGKEGDRYACRQ